MVSRLKQYNEYYNEIDDDIDGGIDDIDDDDALITSNTLYIPQIISSFHLSSSEPKTLQAQNFRQSSRISLRAKTSIESSVDTGQ